MIPGRVLHHLAGLICDERLLHHVVEPAIADLQKEYGASGGCLQRARTLLSGYLAIQKVIALCVLSAPATANERQEVARTLAWSVAMVVAIAALLMLPPLYGLPGAMNGWYAVSTLAQAFPLAIPVGIAFGIAFGLRAGPTMSTAKRLLLTSLAASLLSFAILGWAMPAANFAFRESTSSELETRGYQDAVTFAKAYNEMTLSELRGENARLLRDGESPLARQLSFSFHRRVALAAASLALASLLLMAQAHNRGWRGVLALAVCGVYWVLMIVGEMGSRGGYLPQAVGAWLPNIVLVACAMLIAFFALFAGRDLNRRSV